MKTEKNDMEFVSRQAGFLADQGKTDDEIRTALGNELPDENIGDLIDSMAADHAGNVVLSALQNRADDIGLSATEITRRYARMVQDMQELRRVTRYILRSLKYYVFSMSAVALLVVSIFVTKVIPAFESLFAGFGADLPALTRLVMRSSVFGAWLFLVPVLAFAWFVAEEYYSRKALSHRLIPPRLVWRYFLLSPIARQHFQMLRYWLVQILLESKLAPERCLELADSILRDISPVLLESRQKSGKADALEVSARVGTLEDELEYQIDRLLVELPAAATVQRDQLSTIFTLLVGAVIAVLIFAMYLPIFKLGSVI